ncbi:MAG: M23 family metallopeptidase [Thermoanaerobaculia bacterium]|nr:M23 family metallopeptidase [Thermoanaerobaculia bacterium]
MGTPPSRSPGEGKPFLEVQYHPSDIRKGVRYLFLYRKQVAWTVLSLLAWLTMVGFGVWVSPQVISDRWHEATYLDAMDERSMHGERLKILVQRLGGLEEQTEGARMEMAKIFLAYGLPETESRGKGGYPEQPEPGPQSIYAATIRQGNGLNAKITEELAVLGTFMQEVRSFEQANHDQVRQTPSISPLQSSDFVLTSPYGTRTSPFTREIDFHAGIDMAAPTGTPILAPSDGIVAFAGRYPLRQNVGWWRYGNLVALRHGERFITLYGHCDEIMVKGGDRVEQGDVIATVGDTGWSTNPHLHYEIRRRDEADQTFKPIDPRIYILDHRWRDQERLLIRARRAPDAQDFEPLPRTMRR